MLDGVIDIRDSIAKKTVTFGRPIKGSELVEAVRAACGDDRSFVQEQRYDDGHFVAAGQYHREVDNRAVLVAPTKTDPWIRTDETYESAVVVSRSPGDTALDQDTAIRAVLKFADRLEQRLATERQDELGRGRDPYAPAAGAVTRRPDAAAAQSMDTAAASPRRDGTGRGGYTNRAL